MDYIIDEERYALETVSSHTQYLHNQPQENNFDVGSIADEDAKDDPDVCMKEASISKSDVKLLDAAYIPPALLFSKINFYIFKSIHQALPK
ncbi:unnamed protein product [Rhizopus microsporus]